jgi:single-strand DNA-binding protein
MAWDINQTIILGRLTRDPEVSVTKTNKQICKFSIANNRGKGDQPGDVHFFNVTAWEKLAGTCSQYLKKGSQVIIAGELQQNRWQDETGKARSAVSITARTVQFLGGRQDGENSSAPAMTGDPQQQPQGNNHNIPSNTTGSGDQPKQQNNIDFDNFDNEPLGNDEVPF